MNKKTLLATSLMLAFGASSGSVYAADIITFDPDGTGGANNDTEVVAFDWAVGSSLADGAIPAGEGGTFQLYSHGALQGFQDENGDPAGAPAGLNNAPDNPPINGPGFEITFVLGFGEIVDSFTLNGITQISDGGDGDGGGNDILEFESTILLSGTNGSFENFFEIYYDDLFDATGLKSDALAGTGYRDGTLIASGVINLPSVDGDFNSSFQFVDANDDNLFNPADGDTFAPGSSLLDLFNADNWAGQLTVDGQGATTLGVDLDFQDNTFFKDTITALALDLFFNTSNVLPFEQTNPSQSFDTELGGALTLAGGGIDLGTMNGVSGPDLLLQTDANNSFVTTVPAPGSLALLGLGLSGLGLISRRRRRAAATAKNKK